LHRYLASQNAVKNVIILPANFDVTTYVDCFNDLKSIKVDSLEKCLKQLSSGRSYCLLFSQRGLMMIQLLQFYKFRRKTISAHRRNILAKLNLKNRNELYLYALAIKEGDQ
jgi:predicted glycosyltransferase